MAALMPDESPDDDASVDVLVRRTEAALRDLGTVDFSVLGEVDLTNLVLGFQRLRGRFEVTEARAVRAFDDAGVWALDGGRSAASWLAWRRHIPMSEAKKLVRHARAVAKLPALEQAWEAGAIGPAHITTMLRLDTPRTHDEFVDGHEVLVDVARSQHFSKFKQACDYWALAADPDGAEQHADGGREARSLRHSQSFDGQWYGNYSIDPVSGTIVDETLKEIDTELFNADWAEAKGRLGRTPNPRELCRTPTQRRADALVEMAVRARTAPAHGRRPRPLFSVLVGYETLRGTVLELFNRTVLTPATAAAWLGHADVERIVFDTPSRVIDAGKPVRFYRGALRHVIEIRDRTCWHPTCDQQPQRPEIDHITDASHGGPTSEANGRWGCSYHNHHRTPPRNLDPP